MFLFSIVPMGIQFGISQRIDDFYHFPHTQENAVIDFDGYDFAKEKVIVQTKGNVEFYYNRWIETDHDNGPMDAYLSLPSSFAELKLDGKRLPLDGYASYAVTLLHLPAGKLFQMDSYMGSKVPYRAFANGNLIAVYSSPTKAHQSPFYRWQLDFSRDYVIPEDGKVRLVIETGNTGEGGLKHWMAFNILGEKYHTYGNFLNHAVHFAYGFSIAAFIIAGFFFGMTKKWVYLFTFLMVFLSFSFSIDSPLYRIYYVSYSSSFVLSTLFLGLAFVFFELGMKRYFPEAQIKMAKPLRGISYLFLILSFIGLCFTTLRRISLIPNLIGVIGILLLFLPYFLLFVRKKMPRELFICINAICICLMGYIYLIPAHMSILANEIAAAPSLHLILIMVTFTIYAIYYLSYGRRLGHQEQETRSKMVFESFKRKTSLYSPKEVEDALIFLEKEYEKDVSKANATLSLLSSSLRDSIIPIRSPFVSAEKEADMLLRYTRINNEIHHTQVEAILDMEGNGKVLFGLFREAIKPVFAYPGEQTVIFSVRNYRSRTHVEIIYPDTIEPPVDNFLYLEGMSGFSIKEKHRSEGNVLCLDYEEDEA